MQEIGFIVLLIAIDVVGFVVGLLYASVANDMRSKIVAALHDQQKQINRLTDLFNEFLKEQEAVKPKINEYGEAFCECGENVGIIPNSKQLPSVRVKFCPECGKPILWESR